MRLAFVLWCATSAAVAASVIAACPAGKSPMENAVDEGDGHWYRQIAADGYSYGKFDRSRVAFFPAYPLAARTLSVLSRIPVDAALLVVSNGFFLAALVVLGVYFGDRVSGGQQVQHYAITSIALFPSTFFFRMAYAESTLLLAMGLVWLGMQRKWPRPAVAVLAGLATAARRGAKRRRASGRCCRWN